MVPFLLIYNPYFTIMYALILDPEFQYICSYTTKTTNSLFYFLLFSQKTLYVMKVHRMSQVVACFVTYL